MVLKKFLGKKEAQNENKEAEPNNAPATAEEGASQEGQEQGSGNEPATAVHLEQAMVENARNNNQETLFKVYQELLFGDLLLALAPDAEKKEDSDELQVAIMKNDAGIEFAACFTSPAAARRWRNDDGQYVGIRGQDIFKLLEPSPAQVIVINPGSAPFIVLSKEEYRQLSRGVIPQTNQSPVQVTAGQGGEGEEGASEGDQGEDGQMQVLFPPNVFTDDQRKVLVETLQGKENVEAAALGAIRPPNAPEGQAIRTVFLRVVNVKDEAEEMQKFCASLRDETVQANPEVFKDTPFEVGVMPDPDFWVQMHANEIIAFDKNPPEIPEEVKKQVEEAKRQAILQQQENGQNA